MNTDNLETFKRDMRVFDITDMFRTPGINIELSKGQLNSA